MIGRVYKIIHLDSSLCYIGSTCDTLPGRWRSHKDAYRAWISDKNKRNPVALYTYLEQYGCDRFKMLLVKEYQVADKMQLRAYEQLVISRTKNCCNKNAALQLIGTRNMSKHYYLANKDVLSNRMKEYYQTNKDALGKKVKEYGSTRVVCECGTESSRHNISVHRKSAKHARLLAALNAPTQ